MNAVGGRCEPPPRDMADASREGAPSQSLFSGGKEQSAMNTSSESLRGAVRRVVTDTQQSDGRTRREELTLDVSGRTVSTTIRYEDGSEHTYRPQEERAFASQPKLEPLGSDGFVKVENIRHLDAWETPVGDSVAFGTHGAAQARTLFDKEMRPIETVFLNSEAEDTSRLYYQYADDINRIDIFELGGFLYRDPDGILRINVRDDHSGPISPEAEGFRVTLLHDANNRLIEETISFGGVLDSRMTYSRNEFGDVITCKSRLFRNEGAEPSEQTAVFEYKYDDKGNWVEKKCVSTPTSDDTISRRQIEYYESDPPRPDL